MKVSLSDKLYIRAKKVLVGGVNSPVRAFGAVGGTPRFIVRGKGSKIWDCDGKSYIDYLASWGPLILGHAHPAVNQAVSRAAKRGTSFGASTESEVELAELIRTAFPLMEKVRLVNSGTEAVMSALRLARGVTGRDKILKFSGGYHGHSDSLLVSAGSGALSFGHPSSAGVPRDFAQHTLVCPYNDLDAVEKTFKKFRHLIAAVIVEPVAGNMGVVPPDPGFLGGLRHVTQRDESLLIFDEVITGFRLCWGGVQTLSHIEPDITCLGKIVGGGLPIGVFGGSARIMDKVSPLGPVYQAGTLSGNPIAVAAGMTGLKILKQKKPYRALDVLSKKLAEGLESAAQKANVPVQINRVGSMMTVFFSSGSIRDLSSAQESDTKRYAQYFHGMLKRGIYLPPSQFEAFFVSSVHGVNEIKQTISAATFAMKEVAHAVAV